MLVVPVLAFIVVVLVLAFIVVVPVLAFIVVVLVLAFIVVVPVLAVIVIVLVLAFVVVAPVVLVKDADLLLGACDIRSARGACGGSTRRTRCRTCSGVRRSRDAHNAGGTRCRACGCACGCACCSTRRVGPSRG